MGSATARIQYHPLTRVGPAEEPVPVRVLVWRVERELETVPGVVVTPAEEDLDVEVVEGVVGAAPGTHW